MVGGNVDRIHGRDLYLAARPSRIIRLITIVTPALYRRFLEFLYVDIQRTGRTLSRPWSRQPNDIMSEIECAQLHSELFRRRHSIRQSHGLFALAKHLFVYVDVDVVVLRGQGNAFMPASCIPNTLLILILITINFYFRFHKVEIIYNRLVLPEFIKFRFKCVNCIRQDNMVRQTVPNIKCPVSKILLTQIIFSSTFL